MVVNSLSKTVISLLAITILGCQPHAEVSDASQTTGEANANASATTNSNPSTDPVAEGSTASTANPSSPETTRTALPEEVVDRACPTDQPAQAVNISAADRKAQVLADVLVDHKDRAGADGPGWCTS